MNADSEVTLPSGKTKADVYEGIAFTFCKCATVALICGRYTLLVAASAAMAFYLMAHFGGRRTTRCVLGPPIVVAFVWGLVAVASGLILFAPDLVHSWLKQLPGPFAR